MFASRRVKAGGGVALLVRDGLIYRERPDLGTFIEGVFESVFVEIVRGGGHRNDIVGSLLLTAGAEAIIVCQIKPMTHLNVIPYNDVLNDFLNSQSGGFGIATQIRMQDIKPNAMGNGFHILPDVVSVLDRTYACAIRGLPVPCPTQMEDFMPMQVRRRWVAGWPRVGGWMNHHGW